MRLNRNYQKYVDKVWWIFWGWQRYWEKDEYFDCEAIYDNFPPLPKEPFRKWFDRVGFDNSFRIIELYFNSFGDASPIPQEEFKMWCDRTSGHTVFPATAYPTVVDFFSEQGKILILPVELHRVTPPPIPWTVRFPTTYFLNKIPPWCNEGKIKSGRPPKDWASNLLVYELSQAGMKNMEVAKLLFRERSEKLDKDPVLVRINTIIKTVEKAISHAYRFPQPT
jgi:hypothetical protein